MALLRCFRHQEQGSEDRKSTRLNSSHRCISYAVFCLTHHPPPPPLFPYTTLFRSDGALVAHWLQEDGPDPESYKLKLSWSHDRGRTWSAPMTPHHDTAQTQHGFASLFQAPGAGLGLVWLDGRAINPDAQDGAGNMALRAAIFDA